MYRQGWVNDLTTQADIIGQTSKAALAFDDPQAATETLHMLRLRPDIVTAAVHRPDGSLFATYQRLDGTAPVALALPSLPGYRFTAREVTLWQPILDEQGKTSGYVSMQSLHDLTSRVVDYLLILATVVSILGALGTLLAQAPDNDAMQRCFGQIHTVKGNPFPEEIKAIWRTRFGARQIGSNAYGLTEALITSVPAGEPVPPGSSGRCAPEFDVRIFDDQDNPLPPGQAGEVVCRPLHPDIMFKGYWRRAEDTQKVMGNMWFHTGDIGKFDEAGFFYFVDRKKDYLRRRGENISSFEMESAILLHPDVEQVAVHAVRSNLGEDDLKVTAMLVAHAQLTEEALCRWLVDRVPYYAVPRYIEFRSGLPVNPQGRVLKYQLRDEGVTPATWDIEKSSIKVQR